MTAAPDPQARDRRDDRVPTRPIPTLAPAADIGVPETRAGGILRITTARRVDAWCLVCTAEFTNTGAAASHARAARHGVTVDYSTTFLFAPAELLARLADGGAP